MLDVAHTGIAVRQARAPVFALLERANPTDDNSGRDETMGVGETGSVNAPAHQAGPRAAPSSADGAARSEFAKAKDSAGKSGAEPKPEQTGGTDMKNLSATAIGAGVIDRHPRGPTLAVPDNFDRGKIKAYEQRIKDPFDLSLIHI